jgi:hypothetical protein
VHQSVRAESRTREGIKDRNAKAHTRSRPDSYRDSLRRLAERTRTDNTQNKTSRLCVFVAKNTSSHTFSTEFILSEAEGLEVTARTDNTQVSLTEQ